MSDVSTNMEIDSTETSLRVSERRIILVVDDVPANFTTVINMLPEAYEVCTAKSGQDALNILNYSFADIALLDIEMPNMSGIELFQKMLDNPDYCSIPVIFVTADNSDEIVTKVLKMGARGYVVKPYDGGVLVQQLTTALKTAAVDQGMVFLDKKLRDLVEAAKKDVALSINEEFSDLPLETFVPAVTVAVQRIQSYLNQKDYNTALQLIQNLTSSFNGP